MYNMSKIRGNYRGVNVTLYKIKEYDSLKIREGCDTVECRGNIWIGFCGPYEVYVIYAADTDAPQYETYTSPDLILTFRNEKTIFPECRILSCAGNATSIEFVHDELMWKIHISMEQSEPVRKELVRIWSNARDEWSKEELARSISNSKYGLAVPYSAPHTYFDERVCKCWSKALLPDIKNVIFNPPATIIFWEDNTKTVVEAQEPFDPEKGLAMAIAKKALGNKGNYYETIKKWLKCWRIPW